MDKTRQRFGGDWTEEKLRALDKYLAAYTTIMAKKKFRFAYIDAFAGTGYREIRVEDHPDELLLPELAADDTQAFVRGSARIALEVRPRFDKYIFVEKDPDRFSELEKLRDEYESLRQDI